tara:strand:+ start:2347 stop:3744 length:1398 start_codon:yes stop_codon:yes gene_type:complete
MSDSNNIREDLALFNHIVDLFLKDEIERPVSDYISPENLQKELDLSLNEDPCIAEDFKDSLKKLVLSTPKSSSKLFFNQLFGGRQSKGVLGDLLAVMLNNSMATYKIAGPQVAVEKEIVKSICRLIGYPENSGGTFPTGGSMSNFMSMVMARDKKNKQIINRGFKEHFVAYSSETSHYSISKNASFCGLGKENVRYVKCNKHGQMDVMELEMQIKKDLENNLIPFYINATSGTTVLCAFDNIDEISKISSKYDLWLHVDGAVAGSVLFSKTYSKLIRGVAKSDSFCFNAHKTLGVPLSTSVLISKNGDDLYNSFNNEASYLYQTHNDDYNLGQTSFECGRRNNSLKLWVLWKAIGTSGLEKIVDHEFDLAKHAREYVSSNSDYELYNFKDSLSVCFNFKNYDPIDLCSKLYERNKIMVGYGRFNDKTFVRLVTINSQNTKKEIDSFFKILEKFSKDFGNEIKKIN